MAVARNRMDHSGVFRVRHGFWLLIIFSLLFIVAKAFGGVQLPPFDTYNRAMGQGSEIRLHAGYQQQPADRLTEGSLPPSITGWETHSTLTTGLFRVAAPVKKKITFYVRTDPSVQGDSLAYLNILWVGLRYFNDRGVLLRSGSSVKIPVPDSWMQVAIPLQLTERSVAYAELWMVKYQDAAGVFGSSAPVQGIYVSGIQVED